MIIQQLAAAVASLIPKGINPSLGAISSLTRLESESSGDLPITSFRLLTTGDIEQATGDSGAVLVYTKVGEWLNEVPPVDSSDWEIQVTVDAEDVGDPGTWFGSFRGSFVTLDFDRNWNWQKDGTDLGEARSDLTIILRQVSDTANSTSKSTIHRAEITL